MRSAGGGPSSKAGMEEVDVEVSAVEIGVVGDELCEEGPMEGEEEEEVEIESGLVSLEESEWVEKDEYGVLFNARRGILAEAAAR